MIKVLSAFVAGIATGLLFAPQSGERTREKIAGIFNTSREDLLASQLQYAEEPVRNVYEKIELEDKTAIEPSLYSKQ